MRTVNKSQALDMLRQVSKDNEDKIVLCRYVLGDNEPECIIGHVLVRFLDVDPEFLALRNYQSVENIIDFLPEINFTIGAKMVLDVAQFIQDGRLHGLKPGVYENLVNKGANLNDRTWGNVVKVVSLL